MAVYKLQLDDFNTIEYELIGIHTSLEICKLAFLMNQKLNVQFRFFDQIEKNEKNSKGNFDRYLFEDSSQELSWNLVENKCVVHVSNINESLFKEIDTTMYLVPEYKNVDFILKIDNEDEMQNIETILQTITEIYAVSMSYKIKKEKIKTISNLIF